LPSVKQVNLADTIREAAEVIAVRYILAPNHILNHFLHVTHLVRDCHCKGVQCLMHHACETRNSCRFPFPTVKVTTVFVQVLREDEFNILGKLAISILGTVRS
jgi:hypothetical protein